MSTQRFDPMATALAALTSFAGSGAAARLGLRKPAEQLVYMLTREGFRAAKSAARTFQAAGRLLQPARPGRPARGPDLFDLNPTDEQRMIQEPVRALAEGHLRSGAAAANEACATPTALCDAAHALGIAALAIPEALGGAGVERSVLTSVLVSEELARGDMGMAVAILAPIGVANALSLWGSAEQQERYLPPFLEDESFSAALAVAEPAPLFDPFTLSTRARREGTNFILDGVKSLVPLAAEAELFLVAAALGDEGPALFVVDRGAAGLTTAAEPAMGIRAAALGRLELQDVSVAASARIDAPYQELIDLSRLAWCALAVGTGQAVLDYVIPYVNERVAFGEPISNRQSVAFLVSNIAIEIEAMRLLVLRAASRADQGLPFHRDALLARTLGADKAMEIGSSGVQLLGGHGYVKEHPVERWYRDLRAAAILEGGVLA